MRLQSWRRRQTHAVADCLTCGTNGLHLPDYIEPQRGWATRHALANPGHEVHLTAEAVRAYRAEA